MKRQGQRFPNAVFFFFPLDRRKEFWDVCYENLRILKSLLFPHKSAMTWYFFPASLLAKGNILDNELFRVISEVGGEMHLSEMLLDLIR